jgi:hypothetical protein
MMTRDRVDVECEVCHDSGWERFECTGDQQCNRTRRHPPHFFVRPCSCRAINRNYQERVARSRRHAA